MWSLRKSRISHTLGQGAFGTVRRRHWAGSDVAVKTIRIPKHGKGQMLHMIVSEVGINARLRHPNIVQFLAIAKEPFTVRLVNEFIDGYNMEEAFTTMRRIIWRSGHMTSCTSVGSVCREWHNIHTIQPMTIHRGINPGNIMIKKGCYTMKLCDLGISLVKCIVEQQ